MPVTEEQIRLIFGLKLRQIRTEKGLSLFGLSKKTGLSKSYLNEIEKGKKYPKPDKIVALAEALQTPYDELVSMKLTGSMAPLSDIIKSGILKEIPLELFGIEEGNLIDIIANAPEKVTAFISTLFEIARNYDLSRENFYLAALRSYQESHENYFPELEEAARTFSRKYQLNTEGKLQSTELEEVLTEEFGYTIRYDGLSDSDYPDVIRSVFLPKKRELLIAPTVSETQRVFILAKELGYCHLQITQRPLTFTWIQFESFDDVLHNFQASYFAGALILPEEWLVQGIKAFFAQETWNPQALLKLLLVYTDSAETFFQRLTNLLPKHFGLRQLFFLRLGFVPHLQRVHLTKELHLSRSHQPHAIRHEEHYCRRWTSTDILLNPEAYSEAENLRVGVQHSVYPNSGETYLILSASNQDPVDEGVQRSVCIGIEMSTSQKKKIVFAGDPSIPQREVGVTCERCGIADCAERVREPHMYNRQTREKEIRAWVENLTSPAASEG